MSSISREKRVFASAARATIDPDKLHEGLEVQAWAVEPDEGYAGYWAAVVLRVEVVDGACLVTVKYKGAGARDQSPVTLNISQIRPYDYIELVEGKRTRTQSSKTYISAEPDSDGDADRPANSTASTQHNHTATRAAKKSRASSTNSSRGSNVVKIIIDSRPAGDSTEHLTVFMDNAIEWLPTENFYDNDSTVTGALLAYKEKASRIVQTYHGGQELLVAFHGKGSGDWARIPASAFTPAQLETLRSSPTFISDCESQVGVDRMFQAVSKAIRAREYFHLELGFPTYLAAAILKGKGTRLPQDQPLHGDQTLVRFTQAEMQQIFGAYGYEVEWDQVINARGQCLGEVNWAPNGGVSMRWFARESRQPTFAYVDRDARGKVRRLPLKWIEMLEVRVDPVLG